MTDDHVYVLRCCPPSMVTTNGFRWPESGPVECPDWDPTPECGQGLHGWLWGDGDAMAASGYDCTASRWLAGVAYVVRDGKLTRKDGAE